MTAFVLLIGCVNVANLLLVRGSDLYAVRFDLADLAPLQPFAAGTSVDDVWLSRIDIAELTSGLNYRGRLAPYASLVSLLGGRALAGSRLVSADTVRQHVRSSNRCAAAGI